MKNCLPLLIRNFALLILLFSVLTATLQAQSVGAIVHNFFPEATGQRPVQQYVVKPKPRFVAYAYCNELGVGGGGVNAKSLRQAKRWAMRVCRQRGGTDCIVKAHAGNGCAAVASGDRRGGGEIITFDSGTTRNESNQKVLRNCAEDADDCRVVFSECSISPGYEYMIGETAASLNHHIN